MIDKNIKDIIVNAPYNTDTLRVGDLIIYNYNGINDRRQFSVILGFDRNKRNVFVFHFATGHVTTWSAQWDYFSYKKI